MGWRDWPYWLRGGIITSLISIQIIWLFSYFSNFLGWGNNLFAYLAWPLFAALFGLASVENGDVLTAFFGLVSGIILTLLIYFLLGAILGAIYGRSNNKKRSLAIIIIILFLTLVSLAYYLKEPSLPEGSEDCKSPLNKLQKDFNSNRCYLDLAINNQDYQVCNNIKPDKEYVALDAENYKWFCYEEVAHAKNDPSICDLIPEKTYNRFRETHQKDACYLWFKLCDKIQNQEWKESCLGYN